MKTCVNCGAEIAEEEIMCPVCGLSADEEVLESESPEAENSVLDSDNAEPDQIIEAGSFTDTDDETADDAGDETEEGSEPPKNRWTGLATAIVIITALVLLGLAAFILYKEGTLQKWWEDIRPKTKSACTMEDYSEIQVLKSAVEVSDATVDDYILSMLGEDLTDESVAAYAAANADCDAKTVDEFREYARDYIYKYYLHNEMMNYLKSITTVNSYDEVKEEELIAYATEELEYSASNYGMDANAIASYYGYESALAYATDTAHEYMTIEMILSKVIKDKGLECTEEGLRAEIDKFLEENGYTAYYPTTDEFLEMAGDTWVYLFDNLTYKFDIVTEALEPNVVLIDEPAE